MGCSPAWLDCHSNSKTGDQVAARIADCPALADLTDEAITLVGRDVLDGHAEVLYRRLEELEADLHDLDQRFNELENTADLDSAQGRLLGRLP